MNKEIKKMAKEISEYVKSREEKSLYIIDCNEEFLQFSHNMGVAEALYNAGYRNCKALLEENEKLVHDYYNVFDVLQEMHPSVEEASPNVEEMQKQAIKEFAEKIKNKIITRDYIGQVHNGRYFSTIEINDLLKEYGIGED